MPNLVEVASSNAGPAGTGGLGSSALTGTGTSANFLLWWAHNPLAAEAEVEYLPVGKTLLEVVEDLSARTSIPLSAWRVSIATGERVHTVPSSMWRVVRPRAGATVRALPEAQGAFIAPAISIAVSAGSSWFAGTVLGLTGFAASAFTAVASILGGFLTQKLIRPPSVKEFSEPDRYSIGAANNPASPDGPVPRLFGRRLYFPPKSAAGYTETHGFDMYRRERFCLSYGPIAVHGVFIGSIKLEQLTNVQIEFLNVDKALSELHYPALKHMNVTYRQGTQPMTLYSRDISEDNYGTGMDVGTLYTRDTRSDTSEVVITVGFNGFNETSKEGEVKINRTQIRFYWKPADSAGGWTGQADGFYEAATRQVVYFEGRFGMPYPGRWTVGVQILNVKENGPRDTGFDSGFLASIKSIRTTNLPSHENIAEMVLYIKATDQLNGHMDRVSVLGHAILPEREGGAWTAPRLTRHAAAAWAACLRGGSGNRAVADDELDLDELDEWFAEKHWTYDAVKSGGTVMDWCESITATGRRRHALVNFKHTPVGDKAKDHVRGWFAPHNSRNFETYGMDIRPIHAIRVEFTSEARDWQRDSVYVYAPGYNKYNATAIEPLVLEGVVVMKGDTDKIVPYRLGHYFMRQYLLRRRQFKFEAGPDYRTIPFGSKIEVVRDTIQFGYGSGIVTSVLVDEGRVVAFRIDEHHNGAETFTPVEFIPFNRGASDLAVIDPSGQDVILFDQITGYKFRVTVRKADGSGAVTFTAARPEGLGNDWIVLDVNVHPDDVEIDSLVMINVTTEEPVHLILKDIEALDDDHAVLYCEEAAPAVLDYEGAIPAYDPNITPLRDYREYPAPPTIVDIRSDESTMIRTRTNTVAPRIAAVVKPKDGTGLVPAYKSIRWRRAGGTWRSSALHPIDAGPILTDELEEGIAYTVVGIVHTRNGVSSDPSAERVITAYGLTIPPKDVLDFNVSILSDTAVFSWRDQTDELDIASTDIRFTPVAGGDWKSAQPIGSAAFPSNTLVAPPRRGTYLARNRDHGGRLSENVATLFVGIGLGRDLNAVETFDYKAEGFVGTHTGTVVEDTELRLQRVDGAYLEEGVFEAAHRIDLGEEYPCVITASMLAYGLVDNPPLMKDWTTLAEVASLSGADQGTFEAELQLNVYSPLDGEWSGWQTVSGGLVRGSMFDFRVVLRSLDPLVTPSISMLTVEIDMPDRIERRSSVSSSAGTRIDFEYSFQTTPNVLVTVKDKPEAVSYELTNETRTGFDIVWKDAAGNALDDVPFNWQANGYGKEIV